KADHWFLFSNVFTSHASVASLARHDERVAILAYQTGHFEVTPNAGAWRAAETVRSLSDTFADLNRNFVFDAKEEKRQAYVMGAAAERTAGEGRRSRVLVFGDATVASDAVLRNPGNLLYLADGMKWLV